MDTIQSTSLRDIEAVSRPVQPGERYEVGASYFCAYWQYVCTVVAIDESRGYQAVLVHCPKSGETWSHGTALSRGDRRML